MSIYSLSGSEIQTCYNKSGGSLSQAYDVSGNALMYGTLKVATYNVGQWYLGNHDNVPANRDAEYYALQNGMISSIDPDILLLEEYVDQFSKAGRTALSMLQQHFPYIRSQGGGSTTTGYGRCICSKYPITNYTVRQYTHGTDYYFDSCNITAGGITFTVFVTHLHWMAGLPDTDREAEVAELISVASQMQNVIIGGDFNTAIGGSATEEQNIERYNTFVKPFVDAGFNSANFSEFGNFVTCIDGPTAESNNWYLDNIYTSSNIEIVGAYVDTTKLTDGLNDKIDHMPLVAELSIGSA